MSVTLNLNNNSSDWIGISFYSSTGIGWFFESLTFTPKPSNDFNMQMYYKFAPNTNYTITISQNLPPPDTAYFFQIPDNTTPLTTFYYSNHIKLTSPFSNVFRDGSMTSWLDMVILGLYFTVEEVSTNNELTLTIFNCSSGITCGTSCCTGPTVCCTSTTTCNIPENCT